MYWPATTGWASSAMALCFARRAWVEPRRGSLRPILEQLAMASAQELFAGQAGLATAFRGGGRIMRWPPCLAAAPFGGGAGLEHGYGAYLWPPSQSPARSWRAPKA